MPPRTRPMVQECRTACGVWFLCQWGGAITDIAAIRKKNMRYVAKTIPTMIYRICVMIGFNVSYGLVITKRPSALSPWLKSQGY